MKDQTSFTDSFEITSLKKHGQQIDSLQELQQNKPRSIIKVFARKGRTGRIFHKSGDCQYQRINSRQYVHQNRRSDQSNQFHQFSVFTNKQYLLFLQAVLPCIHRHKDRQ